MGQWTTDRRIFAIGDLQGCLEALEKLLFQVQFQPARDKLWFVGDLVNRGPDSLAVLRRVKSLCEQGSALTVLGNHDLHLLAYAAGIRKAGKRDTLDDILLAPDRNELLDWLRHQPLVHHDAARGWTLVHAGLPPPWDVATALALAAETEAWLQSPDWPDKLALLFGNEPDHWEADGPQQPAARRRYAINAFTRMRFVHPDGRLEFRQKGAPPAGEALGLLPWFMHPWRRSKNQTNVLFGHWSALGRVLWPEWHAWGLDTGAVWGNRITAFELTRAEVWQMPTPEYREPDGPGED